MRPYCKALPSFPTYPYMPIGSTIPTLTGHNLIYNNTYQREKRMLMSFISAMMAKKYKFL